MSDLVEFLLARIAEDEGVVRVAERLDERWATGDWRARRGTSAWLLVPWQDAESGTVGVDVGAARVLAECQAKRRIVAVLNRETPVDLYVLRALADPYADHPDFREEWRA